MPQKKNNSKQTKVSAERNGDKPQNAYFLSLELENIRCFGERQKIDFSDNNKPKQWTIILGNNGTGKTTILQCLIALLPSQESSEIDKNTEKFVAPKDSFRERGLTWGVPPIIKSKILSLPFSLEGNFSIQQSLKAKPTDNLELGINSSPHSLDFLEITTTDISVGVNCFAFGASRKAGETSLSEVNDDSEYATLFDETILLINPEEWLLQADYASKRSSEFKEKREREVKLIKKILIDILPDIDNIKFSETQSGRTPKPTVEFHTPYGWVESKDLSLGYRTSMAWIVDFASRMFDLYPESENPLAEPAVVLIDEIDLHLHPKWQRELIDYLTNLFPNTQFIVTTHSPLIVQAAAARDANIVVCRRMGDHVVIDQSVEAVENWRADQILTSDLFGLETARPKKIEPFLEERQKILSKAKLTKKDEKRLQELEEKIGVLPVSENPEDDKAMDIIRRAAERLQSQAK